MTDSRQPGMESLFRQVFEANPSAISDPPGPTTPPESGERWHTEPVQVTGKVKVKVERIWTDDDGNTWAEGVVPDVPELRGNATGGYAMVHGDLARMAGPLAHAYVQRDGQIVMHTEYTQGRRPTWDDPGATPLQDIIDMRRRMEEASGMVPTTIEARPRQGGKGVLGQRLAQGLRDEGFNVVEVPAESPGNRNFRRGGKKGKRQDFKGEWGR